MNPHLHRPPPEEISRILAEPGTAWEKPPPRSVLAWLLTDQYKTYLLRALMLQHEDAGPTPEDAETALRVFSKSHWQETWVPELARLDKWFSVELFNFVKKRTKVSLKLWNDTTHVLGGTWIGLNVGELEKVIFRDIFLRDNSQNEWHPLQLIARQAFGNQLQSYEDHGDALQSFFLPLRRNNFKLTNDSFKRLQQSKLPNDVITALQPLKDKGFRKEEVFELAIEKLLTLEQRNTYLQTIVHHAQLRPSRFVTTVQVFDPAQAEFCQFVTKRLWSYCKDMLGRPRRKGIKRTDSESSQEAQTGSACGAPSDSKAVADAATSDSPDRIGIENQGRKQIFRTLISEVYPDHREDDPAGEVELRNEFKRMSRRIMRVFVALKQSGQSQELQSLRMFWYSWHHQKKYEEIATAFGKKNGAVRTAISRTLDRIEFLLSVFNPTQEASVDCNSIQDWPKLFRLLDQEEPNSVVQHIRDSLRIGERSAATVVAAINQIIEGDFDATRFPSLDDCESPPFRGRRNQPVASLLLNDFAHNGNGKSLVTASEVKVIHRAHVQAALQDVLEPLKVVSIRNA